MKAFVAYTEDDDVELVREVVRAACAGLRAAGFDTHAMVELNSSDHVRLGLTETADFMRYAFNWVAGADLVVCIAVGNRLGYGALLEAGFARGRGIPVVAARTRSASSYLDSLADSQLVFTDAADLRAQLSTFRLE